ncbi:adenylate/guanylate cyclase domain-containing protein [Enterovirga sp. CN4-39]|uniref:adenylate/guanylate cyclase domain-containing protein n=1 Tax=Enterovirga sp. CN4-39 TaxID=3400910 RepID=UPI003C0BFBE7
MIVGRIQRLVEMQARIERTRDNLARFVPANLVDELAEIDEPFGPVRTQKVAVLFVDIVGFTALCETMPPSSVIRMLRGSHQRMADCVFEHGGTLDKFVGDSVMATFGTPRPGTRDAADALACAKSMLDQLEAWNVGRCAIGEPPLSVGIGLHFGPVVLGEIGNERRLELAVLGDTVNTASRLEVLTRRLGTPLVASQELIARVREEVGELAVELVPGAAPIAVRGRARPVEVWTLNRACDGLRNSAETEICPGTSRVSSSLLSASHPHGNGEGNSRSRASAEMEQSGCLGCTQFIDFNPRPMP